MWFYFFIALLVIIPAFRIWMYFAERRRNLGENLRGEFVFGDVTLGPNYIQRRGGPRRPVAGVTATVETVGQLQRRITATRLATLGVFALALQKRQDDRELFITIMGPDFQWLLELPPDEGYGAREFVAAINAAGLKRPHL